MKVQNKPDYLIFASDAQTGELESFPNIARGWGVTIEQTESKPPMEWMNDAFNRIDKNMLYLLQQGVPEWDSSVLYPVDAVIKYKGQLYIALLENDEAIPPINEEKWNKLIKEASTTQKGIVQLSSAIDSDSETTSATSKAVKTAYDLANSKVNTTDFQNLLSTNGYQKLPSGLIEQWGIVTLPAVGDYNRVTISGINYYTHYYEIVLPTQFPHYSFSVIVTPACGTFTNQFSMAELSVSANLSSSDIKSKFIVSVTTQILGFVPTIHYIIKGY